MYKAIYKIQKDCINPKGNVIFTPFLRCYMIHSVFVNINGSIEDELTFQGNYTIIESDFPVDMDWNITFDINYFYINPYMSGIFDSLIDTTFNAPNRSREIAAKHYAEGQFSLDNGLYKNAVLNFGTTLECLLNKRLDNTTLGNLINKYKGDASKDDMKSIKEMRNKIHPNNIKNFHDISRIEAIDARNRLEVILNKF